VAQAARLSLEQLTTNASWRLNALHDLQQDAVARKSLPDALRFSKQLATGPAARFGDKIDYLQLLRVSTNADFAPWLASVEIESTNSPARAFALGRWMAMTEGPTNALRWLQSLPTQTRTNQPVPLIVTDCRIALKDWAGLLALVDKQDWAEANFYRLALESLAHRSLGKDYASQAAWRNALRQSAHRLDRLSRLAQVTAGWGWPAENTEVLREITSEFPKEKWAANSLMADLYAAGNTRELMEFVTKMNAADPADVRIKNNLANLYLLRKSDLDKAYRLAREAYDASPTDPFFTSTYAYSLLLQKKSDEALKIFSDLKPEYLQIPSIAAYYGVVQAQSGHKDLAKEPLHRAETAKLLPEEKDLVRLAESRL
jgi:tetratricopeptide (TPR) repeat protein